ncbi:hypothetical protein [Cryobacterium sp. Y82]|uniref:hypothetical protein n=1 Tax=Cryobacterium sp. Y82 TaxID=2045017 RepID=UPI000CE4B186|nr:hypothetical protein [Cryobacterium sp. Y82]
MQTLYKLALGAAVVLILSAGSAGAVALTSALTIDDQPGLVQLTDPVSTVADPNATGAGALPESSPTASPTAPVAVPPAGSQTIDDDDDDDDDLDINDVDDVDVDDVDVDVDND